MRWAGAIAAVSRIGSSPARQAFNAADSPMAKSIHLRIQGKVQGVGFRWFVREQARRCDLAGWVRNNRDGSVELRVAGDDDCIARFRSAVGVGPNGARVERVEEVPTAESAEVRGELPYPFQMER
jgi:acylphosphatase